MYYLQHYNKLRFFLPLFSFLSLFSTLLPLSPLLPAGNVLPVPNIITNAVAGTRRSTPSTAAMRPVIAARTESAFGAAKGDGQNELFVDLVEQMTVLFGAAVCKENEGG
jgi:hypothetical protein